MSNPGNFPSILYEKKKKKNQASLTVMYDNIRIYHLGHNLGLLGPNLDHKNFT